eukprot:Skav204633  [mRNA]  locus=scaffold1712:351768:352070:+ [translate_table: standard]
MRQVLHMALARDHRELESATAKPKTNTYDVFHHRRLREFRESYWVHFVTDTGAVLDSHPDYLKGALCSGLQDKTGLVTPLPKKTTAWAKTEEVFEAKPFS